MACLLMHLWRTPLAHVLVNEALWPVMYLVRYSCLCSVIHVKCGNGGKGQNCLIASMLAMQYKISCTDCCTSHHFCEPPISWIHPNKQYFDGGYWGTNSPNEIDKVGQRSAGTQMRWESDMGMGAISKKEARQKSVRKLWQSQGVSKGHTFHHGSKGKNNPEVSLWEMLFTNLSQFPEQNHILLQPQGRIIYVDGSLFWIGRWHQFCEEGQEKWAILQVS